MVLFLNKWPTICQSRTTNTKQFTISLLSVKLRKPKAFFGIQVFFFACLINVRDAGLWPFHLERNKVLTQLNRVMGLSRRRLHRTIGCYDHLHRERAICETDGWVCLIQKLAYAAQSQENHAQKRFVVLLLNKPHCLKSVFQNAHLPTLSFR